MSKRGWSWRDLLPEYQNTQEALEEQYQRVYTTQYEVIEQCTHANQKIQIDTPGTLLLTSYQPGKETSNIDVSIYLASCWLNKIEALTYSSKFFNRWGPERKIIFINWPDFEVIEEDLYLHLVKYIVYWLKREKIVQIGCQGGHGRTGTLAAGVLAYSEGLSGEEATAEIRKKYCKKAVENQIQEKFVQNCFKRRINV